MSDESLLYVEIDGIRQPILNPHGELEWRLRYHPAPNDPMIAAGFINSIEYLLNMPHKDAIRRFVAMRRAYKKAKKEVDNESV